MDLEDLPAAVLVGRLHRDAAVEAARPQQGRVEDLRPVGGADDDDRLVGVEPVHLGQDLVERLLALVVGAGDAGRPLPRAADGVELVDEDDRRRRLLGLREQVAHARRADADDRLDELRRRDREEGRVRLARHRARDQRLAGAGRPVEEDAVRDPGAEAHVPVGRLQEVDDLGELRLRLVDSGDVVERDLDRRRIDPARLRPAEVPEPAEAAAGPGGAAAQEHEQCDQEKGRAEPEQDLREQRRPGVRVLGVDLDAVRLQHLRQRGVVPERRYLGREERRLDVAFLLPAGGSVTFCLNVPWIVSLLEEIDSTFPASTCFRKYGLNGTLTRGSPDDRVITTESTLIASSTATKIQNPRSRCGGCGLCSSGMPRPSGAGATRQRPLSCGRGGGAADLLLSSELN